MRGMTGFSYISQITEYGKLNVYLRSLNSRFLEIKLNIPSAFYGLESRIRKMLSDKIKRGKLELTIDFYPKGVVGYEINVNEDLAESYFLSLKKLSNRLGLLPDIDIVDIASMPDVINLVKFEVPSSFLDQVQDLVSKVIEDIIKQKKKEGEEAKKNIMEIISKIRHEINIISLRWVEVNNLIEDKIKERVNKFFSEYDSKKEIDTSIVAFLLKIDINEEIFRFENHLNDLEKLMDSEVEVGKKFEFILQELNREVNTIASKSFDYNISSSVIEIKVALEKIREHIQNIE
ncbi:MAG: YicC/YloC family endoribonuclease [Brevinematia bacterium]